MDSESGDTSAVPPSTETNNQNIDIGDLDFMPLDTETAGQFDEPPALQQDQQQQQSVFEMPVVETASMEVNQASVVGMTDKQNVLAVLFELEDNEIARLEENLRQKLVKNAENFVQQHDLLRSNFEKLKIETEQRFVELEAEFTECQAKLSVEAKNAHLYKLKANENEEKLSTISRQLRILENEKETYLSDHRRLNSVNQNLEAEKRDLLSLIEKKIKDNDRLNEEWKAMNSKLTLSESRVCELTYNLEELQAKEASVALREKQYESDKKRLLNEIEWLNNQIRDKSTQITELKTNFNQKSYELEFKIDDLTSENKKLKNQADMTQSANKSLEEQNEELTRRLQEAREKEIQTTNRLNEETESRERLLQIYEDENKSLREKLEEAAKAISDSNQMVIEVKDEYSRLLDEKKLNESLYESKQKENQDTIAKLEQELKNANELLSIAKRKGATVLSESDIEQLSPAAAVASRLLKGGMTLTQIYSEYVNLTETLQAQKDENENLKQYLNEVIREVEEKAPLIKKQKLEYDEAVKTVNNLTSQLENAMMDYEVLKNRSEDSIKKYNSVSAENARLKQDVADLSRQVTVLLYEVEQLRLKMVNSGTAANRTIELYQTSAETTLAQLFNEEEEVSSSSEAVNKNAHVFRSIEELQKQNQRLARMLNDLSDKKQSEEKIELEMKTREYNEKLALALRELDEIRNQREKQEHLLEEIRKQRDTYKSLLNQPGASNASGVMNSPFLHSTPSGYSRQSNMLAVRQSEPQSSENMVEDDSRQNELQQKLDETLSALDKLRRQFEKYQDETSNVNKSLNEEIDKYRRANSDLSMKAALSDSKLESAIEKCKSLNITIEKYRKEIESLKDRSSKVNEIVIKHEQSLQLANNELDKTREKLSELEIRLHSCTVERDLLKSNYDRVSKENELRIQENTNRASVLSSVEHLRADLERLSRENKHILTQKIEQLERDNLVLKKTNEQQEESHAVIVKSWQSQHDRLAQQLEKQTVEHEQNKQQLADLRGEYEKLQEKYQECDSKLHSHELIVQMSKKSNNALSHIAQLEDDKKEAQSRLSLADKEIVSLKIQLEDSKSHAKQYKTIADTLEKTIKEASEASEKMRQVFEQQISELNQELVRLNKQLEDLNAEKGELEARFGIDRNEYEERISLLEQDKSALMDELDTTKRQLENTEKILNERTHSRDDLAARTSVLEEQLTELTDRASRLESQLADKDAELNQLRMDMSHREAELHNERTVNHETRVAYQTAEQSLRETITTLESENHKLVNQIDMLQQEMSVMGQELAMLQKQDASFRPMSTTSSVVMSEGATTDQSASNMLEINRYLRAQKEQLEEKFESLKLDHDILVQRMANSENEMDSHRKQIEIYENEISQLKTSLSKQHNQESGAESMDTDGVNLILETSKRLKEDLDQANVENGKLNDDLRRIEDEMLNLRTNLTESELKNESLSGENTSMRVELTKWKERVDSFMRSSDVGPEWTRVQQELEQAGQRVKDLEQEIDQKEQYLRQRDQEFKQREDQLQSEIEKSKTSANESKQLAEQEVQLLRGHLEKEKNITNSLRKYVRILGELNKGVEQKLGLEPPVRSSADAATGPKKTMLEKVEEDAETSKKRIFQKIEAMQEELAQKSQQSVEEKQSLEKRVLELEEKLNEKETRLTQITNAMNNFRAKNADLSNQLNQLRTQLKECTDEKESIKGQIEQLQRKLLVTNMENEKLKNLAGMAMNTNVVERVASPVNKPPEQISTPQLAPTTRTGTIKLPTSTGGSSGMINLRRPPVLPQQPVDSPSTSMDQSITHTPPVSSITKRTREEDTPEEADVSSPSSNMIINLNKKSRSNVGESTHDSENLQSIEGSSSMNEPVVEDTTQANTEDQSQQVTSEFTEQPAESQQDTQGNEEFVEQDGNEDSVEFTDVVVQPPKSDGSSQHQVEESSESPELDEGNVESGEAAVGDDEASQTVELTNTTETQPDMIETNQIENSSQIETQQTETTQQASTRLFTRPPAFGGVASNTNTFASSSTGSLFQTFSNAASQPAPGTIISTTSTIPKIRRPLAPNLQASTTSTVINTTTSAFGQPARNFFNTAQQQGNVEATQSFPPPNQYRLVNTGGQNRFTAPQTTTQTAANVNQPNTPFNRGPRAQFNQQNQLNQAGSPGGNTQQPNTTNQAFGRGGGSMARGTGRP